MILDSLLEDRFAAALRPLLAANALGFGLLALSASVFHLGRPLYAFRAVLGLRHSWLSREIVAFGLFAGLATAYAIVVFLASCTSADGGDIVLAHLGVTPAFVGTTVHWLGWSVATVGAVAVFCSIMIYVFTQREFWSFARVTLRFVLTAAVLGLAVVWLTILALTLVHPSPEQSELIDRHGASLCGALIGLSASKLFYEAAIFRHLFTWRMTPLKRSALLMVRELSNFTLARFAAGILGGIVMPLFMLMSLVSSTATESLAKFVVITGLLFVACLVGELLERALFFTACAAPRMPGAIR
jgi:DMSO reductase anchor subunit